MSNPSHPSGQFLPLLASIATAASLFIASCAAPNRGMVASGNSPGSDGSSRADSTNRPGLGTKAGVESRSSVTRTQFYRKSAAPDAVASFYYNDEPGARAMAELLGGGTRRTGMINTAGGRLRAGLVSWGSNTFPYVEAKSRQIVMGEPGQSYQIRLENRSRRRQEVIVSVDSLNVLTGGVAGYSQRGYVINPKSAVIIDGFRVSDDKVRRFEFSSVAASKAAKQGQDRNVGVVGLAVFEEDEAKATMMQRKEQFQREDASAFPVSGR